jgi:osmotically-inducible protein OsmY
MHDRRDPVDAGQIGSGQSLIEAVGQALRATGYPALGRIELEICGGVVVLWGRVPTYHQKQLAQAVAHRVKGVRGIANGIEVLCTR